MRIRHVKGSEDYLAKSPLVIQRPEDHKGHFAEEIFGNDRPIWLEVGMGMGAFIRELSIQERVLHLGHLSGTCADLENHVCPHAMQTFVVGLPCQWYVPQLGHLTGVSVWLIHTWPQRPQTFSFDSESIRFTVLDYPSINRAVLYSGIVDQT